MITCNIGHYQWRAPVWVTLLVVLIMALLVGLGFWQLDRAEWKRHLLAVHDQKAQAAPVDLMSLMRQKNPDLDYTRVKVHGLFDNQKTLLWDNQLWQHQVGYRVLTLIHPPKSDRAVLVDRGFIQKRVDGQLPAISSWTGQQTVNGLIDLMEKKSFVLSNAEENPGQWPRIIQSVDIKQIENITHESIFPFLIILDANQPQGFNRMFKPVIMPPYRHTGYAVQWFLLAATLGVLFLKATVTSTERE